MKTDCLTDRDLILRHYGEIPDGTAVATHLADCAACRTRLERLAADLAVIPAIPDPDPVVATRIAARVTERLAARRRRLPWAGAAVAGAIALGMAVLVMAPFSQSPSTTALSPVASTQVAELDQPFVGPPRPVSRQARLDLELLDQLDLLEELEALRTIEGV